MPRHAIFMHCYPGKTHTMLGVASDPGIIPRVIQSLFKAIQMKQSSPANGNTTQAPEFKVSFSYMEIYNEKVGSFTFFFSF